MAKSAGDEDGFALVEALVGLAIFSLCMTAIVSLTSLWTSASQRSRQNAAWTMKEQAVGRALVSSLESAFLYARDRPGGLDGTPNTLRFVSAPPNGSNSDGHVEIRWTYDDQLSRLSMTMTDDHVAQTVAAESVGVAATFTFFGRTAIDDRPIEHQNWKSDWPAPAYIELRISPANSTHKVSEARHYAMIRAKNQNCNNTNCSPKK
jgi:type II secretory pathway pseudopilin PulG